MKRSYNPPPGYDGSRFVKSGGEIRAMEDSDYTLSVNGIPTRYGGVRMQEKTQIPARNYRSRATNRTNTQEEHFCGGVSPDVSEADNISENSKNDAQSDCGCTCSDSCDAYTDEEISVPDIAADESKKQCNIKRCSPRRGPFYASRSFYKTVQGKKCRNDDNRKEQVPLASLAENGDLLLIMLIFLLSAEKGNEHIVYMLVFLLAIR